MWDLTVQAAQERLDRTLTLLRSEGLGLAAYAAAMLLASTALALASWHLYEKHFLRLKARLRYEESPAAGGVARAEVRAAA